jgi:hypothetical protein
VQELKQPLGNKTQDETQIWDSNVSETSGWNGNACGDMSEQTLTASWTSASEELQLERLYNTVLLIFTLCQTLVSSVNKCQRLQRWVKITNNFCSSYLRLRYWTLI